MTKTKPGKCVYCGKNPDKCEDRVDIYGQNIGDKKWKLKEKNVKTVWGSGFKISKELANENNRVRE